MQFLYYTHEGFGSKFLRSASFLKTSGWSSVRFPAFLTAICARNLLKESNPRVSLRHITPGITGLKRMTASHMIFDESFHGPKDIARTTPYRVPSKTPALLQEAQRRRKLYRQP